MSQIIYFVLFLISVGYLIVLLTKFQKHISVYYTLLSAAVVIVNLGYLQISGAKSLEAALVANQVVYLSSTFQLLFMIAAIADLCKVRVPTMVTILGVCLCFVLFLCAATVGQVDWYYRSVELVQRNGCSFLIKEYGPLHTLYPVYVLGMLCYGLGIVTYTLQRKKTVSHFVSLGSLCLLMFSCFVYLGERLLRLDVELMPMTYVVGFGGILLLLNRVVTYDVEGISRESIEESREYGFVICDRKCRFSGADEQAKRWFPELEELEIDYRIQNFDTDFLTQLKEWVLEGDGREVAYFERMGLILEARHDRPKEHGGALHCIRLRDDTRQQEYLKLVERYNDQLSEQIRDKTARLVEVQNDIIVSMASIVENRDNNTGGHIRRTSDVVRVFMDHLRKTDYSPALTWETAERIIKAAPLHDFGKIAIPDGVLNKPGKFTPEEYALMKLHAQKGAGIVARILQNSDDLQFKNIAVNVAHYHHEKWDGTGYPYGLAETEIPLEARIMALADVFDALASKRVYKDQFGYDKAFSIIAESSGSHFEPSLCQSFLQCRSKIEALYDSYGD